MSAPPPTRRRALARRMRRLAVDTRPLRASRDYRLLWSGELISQIGSQVTLVALFVQVYELTHSSAAVGVIGAVQLVPMVLVSIGLGPQIDLRDRRLLLIGAQLGLMASSLILLGGAIAGHPPLVLVYGAAALNAAFVSLSMPTRAAMTPNLVPANLLAQSAALNQVMWNGAGVVGPALGGVVVGQLGLAWAYGIDVATYVVAVGFALMLRPQRPQRDGAEEDDRGWAAVRNGMRYLKGKRVLQSTFTVDVVAMVFGMPRVLFPVLADKQFHRGPEVVGWLFSAVALGALIGALSSGWVGRVRRLGLAILVAVTVWGAAITAFGLSGDRLWLALVCLAVAGSADVISAVFRSTLQQLVVPDALRGRLSAFNIFIVAGGPRLGDLEGGVVASAFTPTVSVVSGGLLCLGGVAVIALMVPRFARWRIGDPP
ncbi:MAG TPA: MFS transporter [Acidimicrobiia bacterium]|nr:MFS transporter [Acidimicrobiia bacterium]